MKTRVLMLILLAVVAGVLCIALGGCGDSNDFNRVIVTMINNSNGDINMFITPGEDFDPENNLDPGDSRVFSREWALGQTVRFVTVNAGRNGDIIDAKLIQADFSDSRLRSYTATFANGVLTVVQTN